jgi:hypothetical protein
MKNLEAKEKAVLAEKIARKTQLDPLQDKVEQLVMDIDTIKSRVEHIGLDGRYILKPLVTAQMVEAMEEKRNQAQEQCQQIIEMYEVLA